MSTTILKSLSDSSLLLEAEQEKHSARLDAEVLLCFVLNVDRAFLYTWPNQDLDASQESYYRKLILARVQGEPIAYLIGEKEFWSLNFKVNKHTLIPRPETETLIEIALPLLKKYEHANILDLATGSGIIALTLASEFKKTKILASDISEKTLDVAHENKRLHGCDNVEFIKSNWFSNIKAQKYNLIISNPPYIASSDPHLASGDLRFEPRYALASGNDGLDAIKVICQESSRYLADKAYLLLEHGYDQQQAVIDLFKHYGYTNIKAFNDSKQIARAVLAQRG